MDFEKLIKAIEEKDKEYEAEKLKHIKYGNKEEVMYYVGRITGLWEVAGIITKICNP